MLQQILQPVIYLTCAFLLLLYGTLAGIGHLRFQRLSRKFSDGRPASESIPSPADLYCYRALFFHERGQYPAAISDYNRALALEADHAIADLNLERALSGKNPFKTDPKETTDAVSIPGELPEIKETLVPAETSEKFESHDPVSQDLIKEGISYTKNGEIALAIEAFTKEIDFHPESAAAYMNRGIAHTKQGYLDNAIADFDKAIELKPNTAAVYMNRAIACARINKNDTALADLDKAIELKPNYATALKKRGEIFIGMNLFENAVSDYSKAIQIKPDYIEAYINRGRAYAQRGQHDEAKADFDKARAINPNIGGIYYKRGLGQKKSSNTRKALEHFKIACDLGYKKGCLQYREARTALMPH